MPGRYYGYYYYDPTYMLIVISALISLFAQFLVNSRFSKYSRVRSRSGMTGAQAAERILQSQGIYDVAIQRVSGKLTDHYDPRNKTLNLSDAVYASTSVAAVGVAAHECGHAVQYATGYTPIRIRNGIFPVVSICSKLSMPIILLGFILTAFGGMAPLIVDIGIILYSATVVFQLITLPVEFNASSRALKTLESYQMLGSEEIKGAKKVLSAAAMTYVAAAFSALMTLLRLVLLSSNNNRRD